MNIPYIDTGAFYRCVALYKKDNPNCEDLCLENFARDMKIRFLKDDNSDSVILNGNDVSKDIRTPEISKLVSLIAGMDNIRKVINVKLREMGNVNGGILEGRDIQTLVFPNANFKFYLTASIGERAKRRMKDYEKMGKSFTLQAIIEKIKSRDDKDMNRNYGPLKKADDAIEIDTTNLTLEEVVDKIINFIKIT